jgi:glucan biosynthesis protein C
MNQSKRIYYLDWLRVFAFGTLILFHSWQPFTNFHWLLASDNKTIVADIFTVFFHTWRLYLVFFVSGVGTCLALRSRSKQFFNDRFLRLIVPFVFGAIMIVPCQYYYQSLQAGADSTFTDFMLNYPKFIANKDYLGFDPFLWIIEIGIHLWYLPNLFAITLLTYPILNHLSTKGLPEAFMQKVTEQPKIVLLFSVPIILTLIILKPIFPDYTSVTDFFVFTCFFLYGFGFIKEHERLMPVIKKNENILLILGVLSSLTLIGFLLVEPLRKAAFDPEYNLNHLIVSVPIGLSAFSWSFYFVSLFSRKFNFINRALTELNRSILPVYIVHQSIIVVVGYYIIKFIDNGQQNVCAMVA